MASEDLKYLYIVQVVLVLWDFYSASSVVLFILFKFYLMHGQQKLRLSAKHLV